MARFAYVLPLLLVTVAGCQPSAPPTTDTAAEKSNEAAKDSATAPETEPTPAGVTMRYSCEQGHRVDIIGGSTARVTLADGRAIDIPRIADSAPPRYSGVALSFEVGSDGATLGQDEVGGFACRESD